ILLDYTSAGMTFGTIHTMIDEFTQMFHWIGMTFIQLLELLQIQEATEAAQTVVVGFADMFLPAILGTAIETEMPRFIIACLSVTQLIYLSEVGALLLGSKLPINMKDLVIIFLLRTLI